MEIVLIRHGRPDVDLGRGSSAIGFPDLMEAYDRAQLDRSVVPPALAVELASRCAVVVCSDLCRSLESAEVLGLTKIDVRDAMFREIQIPHAKLSFPRLSMRSWVVIFRVLQAFGYKMGAESIHEARARARRCAVHLAELATKNRRVLLVGHGYLNYLISKELTRLGWIGTGAKFQRHWSFIKFAPPAPV